MTEKYTLAVREALRERSRDERRTYRDNFLGYQRKALEDQTVEKEVSFAEFEDITRQIKLTSGKSIKQLTRLKNALFQGHEYISLFLKETGALNALVRDLSGTDGLLQVAAAECCCNLSLGSYTACNQLIRAAGPYLNTHLASCNSQLVDLCAWTIGNICACDERLCDVVSQQGTIAILIGLMYGPSSDNIKAVMYAITRFIGKVGINHNAEVLEIASAIRLCDSLDFWLLYFLTTHRCCDEILLGKNVAHFIIRKLMFLSNETIESNVNDTTALIRSLGNLIACSTETLKVLLQYCMEGEDVQKMFRRCLTSNYKHLRSETLWVLGNAVVVSATVNDQDFCERLSNLLVCDLENDIQIAADIIT